MKLLIADDELLIREAIIARLRKGNYEFETILQAENGIDAKQLIKEYQPEIVITDVRMDGMSGLDLIKSCQSLGFLISFIVISGYAEFEYVQNAMYHGACCYLLKPITQEKLFDALEKAKEKHESMTRLIKMEEENTLLTCNNLFQKCVRSSLTEEEYQEMLSLLETDCNSSFILGMAHLSRYNQDCYFSVANVYSTLSLHISSRSNISFQLLPGDNSQNRHLLFWSKHVESLGKELNDVLNSAIRKINAMGTILTLGLSTIAPCIHKDVFSQGEQALNYRFLLGNGNVYYFDSKNSASLKNSELLDLKTLAKELRFQPNTKVESKLFELLESYYPLVHNFEYLIQFIYEILHMLEFNCDKAVWDSFILEKYWMQCENKKEILDKIREEISRTCQQEMACKDISLTDQTKEYLEANYMENLSLDMIAEKYHLNPRYFSTTFKKKEGITPMDYLTHLRIDAAKNILRSTDTPASNIAFMVGYEDPRYFYKVFKKHTGFTPTEYRQSDTLQNRPLP